MVDTLALESAGQSCKQLLPLHMPWQGGSGLASMMVLQTSLLVTEDTALFSLASLSGLFRETSSGVQFVNLIYSLTCVTRIKKVA